MIAIIYIRFCIVRKRGVGVNQEGMAIRQERERVLSASVNIHIVFDGSCRTVKSDVKCFQCCSLVPAPLGMVHKHKVVCGMFCRNGLCCLCLVFTY